MNGLGWGLRLKGSGNVRTPRMATSRFAAARLVRCLGVPLAIAVPPFFWIAVATYRASLCPLGRDQGIFQYVAWALRHGAVDYVDVRDVNGPLTHLIHSLFLTLGGADEHRFRVLDLGLTGLSFVLVGACLPGLRARAEPLERFGWALAGWVILSGQYLLYDFWQSAQRESFFDWFMLPSVALQLVAQSPAGGTGGRPRRRLLLAIAGALSVIPWFGKPTYVLFTLAQVVTILLDDAGEHALLAFAAGAGLGAASQLGGTALLGDLRAYARIQIVDVPSMYRFIWPRAVTDVFSSPWCATQAVLALAGAVAVLSLIAIGEMPARTLAVALVPLCALGSVAVQGKGFPYHFHPVTAGVHLQWLLLVAWLTERTRVVPLSRQARALVRVVPLAAGLVLSLHVATSMVDSPYVRATWMSWGTSTPRARTTEEYFSHFPEPDFYPFELRQAADYVREHTAATDRVQTYGMDPYVLFLSPAG